MSTLEIETAHLEPRSVAFTATDLVVTFADGRKLSTPLVWYPRLLGASNAKLLNYELSAFGIHWPELDEDLSIPAMLEGRTAKGPLADLLFPELFAQSRESLAPSFPGTLFQVPHHGRHMQILNLALLAPGATRTILESEIAKIGPSANTAPNLKALSEFTQ